MGRGIEWGSVYVVLLAVALASCSSTCGRDREVEFVGPGAERAAELTTDDGEADPRLVRLRHGFEPNPGSAEAVALSESDTGELRAPEPYSACEGWLPDEAQHVFQVDRFFDFKLRLQGPRDQALLMVVEGDGRIYCVQTREGSGLLRASLSEGEYAVRVGSVQRTEPVPYRLTWQHIEEGEVDQVALDEETRSVDVQGVAGGPRGAGTFTLEEDAESCRGFYPVGELHALSLEEATSVRLSVSATDAGGALRLILQGPEGAVCIPSSAADRISWQGELGAGSWSVFVGTEEGSSRPYQLTLRR